MHSIVDYYALLLRYSNVFHAIFVSLVSILLLNDKTVEVISEMRQHLLPLDLQPGTRRAQGQLRGRLGGTRGEAREVATASAVMAGCART